MPKPGQCEHGHVTDCFNLSMPLKCKLLPFFSRFKSLDDELRCLAAQLSLIIVSVSF